MNQDLLMYLGGIKVGDESNSTLSEKTANDNAPVEARRSAGSRAYLLCSRSFPGKKAKNIYTEEMRAAGDYAESGRFVHMIARQFSNRGRAYSAPDPQLQAGVEDKRLDKTARRQQFGAHSVFTTEGLNVEQKVMTVRNRAQRTPLAAREFTSETEVLRAQILEMVEEYARVAHGEKPFVTDKPHMAVSGKVYGAEELRSLVDASLDFWLTTGRYNTLFEKRLGQVLGIKNVLTTNSGSSANLLAMTALTSPLLGDRAVKPGDEVITVAAGFPTTVNPSLINGLVPVFVDVDIPTYNVQPALVEAAITDKTRAIMIAHALGNPFDLGEIVRIAKAHNLWLIEDCCDALGTKYDGKLVGTFGDIGTLSFYPAHHITMGEGGAVFTNNAILKRALESIRDWGRDCWCDPGMDNTCTKRFGWSLGTLPKGYDHKYTYSHLGYNLKITDMQAAVGVAQLDRLAGFIAARRHNFQRLHEGLSDLQEFLILPEATRNSEPSWFGFLITVREQAPFTRNQLAQALNKRGVATRALFAGNLVRQPYMMGRNYRVHGTLENTDRVMNQTFWIGVYPGLSDSHIDFALEVMHELVRELT